MTTLHQHLRRVEEAEACWDRCAAEAAAIVVARTETIDGATRGQRRLDRIGRCWFPTGPLFRLHDEVARIALEGLGWPLQDTKAHSLRLPALEI